MTYQKTGSNRGARKITPKMSDSELAYHVAAAEADAKDDPTILDACIAEHFSGRKAGR